jgi:hypothetical protein
MAPVNHLAHALRIADAKVFLSAHGEDRLQYAG